MTQSVLNNEKLSLAEIKLELTYFCHMGCIHCSSEGSSDKTEFIPYNKAEEIIDSAYNMGVKEIAISGGEPFLWPGLLNLLNFSQSKGFNVKLYTSGSSENFEALINRVNPYHLSVIVSLYSFRSNVHDSVTTMKGSFERATSALQRLVKLGIGTEIHFVPLKTNYADLVGLAGLSEAIGVTRLSVLRFVPQGRGALNHHLALTRAENLNLRSQILRLRDAGFHVRTGSPLNFLCLGDRTPCLTAISKLTIGPDLSIYPCDAFKQMSDRCNIDKDEYSSLRMHSLPDCWRKSAYLNRVRNALALSIKEPCLSCGKFSFCGSGCLAQKVIENRSFESCADPACLFHHD